MKKTLVDFLIWIDRTDRTSRIENGQLRKLVDEYLSQLKPQGGSDYLKLLKSKPEKEFRKEFLQEFEEDNTK